MKWNKMKRAIFEHMLFHMALLRKTIVRRYIQLRLNLTQRALIIYKQGSDESRRGSLGPAVLGEDEEAALVASAQPQLVVEVSHVQPSSETPWSIEGDGTDGEPLELHSDL